MTLGVLHNTFQKDDAIYSQDSAPYTYSLEIYIILLIVKKITHTCQIL